MKKLFILFAILSANIVFGQQESITRLWIDKYTNDDLYASSYCIAIDQNSSVFNAIYSNGTLLKGFNLNGEVIIEQEVPTISFPSDILVDGEYIYIGGGPDLSLCKIDKTTGEVMWTITKYSSGSWASIYAMTFVEDGNIVMACAEAGGSYRLIKVTPEGDFIQDNIFELEGDFTIPRAIAAYPNGDCIVAGESGTGGNSGIALLYITRDGTLDWIKYDSSKSGAQGVVVDDESNIVIAGSSAVNSVQFIHKYDSQGNVIWKKEGYNNYSGFGLIQIPSGNYIVAGGITTDLSTWEGEQSITCYDRDGELLWDVLENEGFSHYAMAMAVNNKNIVLSGAISNTNYEQWAYTSLYELPAYNVSFYIYNEDNSLPIENAMILINSDTLYTNNDGTALYENLVSGEYPYTIRYNSIEHDSIFTVLDSDVEIEFGINSVGITTGIDLIQIYPNPVKDYLYIRINNDLYNNSTLRIVNALGATVHQQLLTSEQSRIEMSKFAAGGIHPTKPVFDCVAVTRTFAGKSTHDTRKIFITGNV